MLHPYNYKITDDGFYEFVTSEDITYTVIFTREKTHFPDNPSIVFDLSFYPDSSDINGKKVERVYDTIVTLIIAFLVKEAENCLVFTCDSNDNKHRSRSRLFDWWFNKNCGDKFIKQNGEIITVDGTIYHSLITSKENPFLNSLIDDYQRSIYVFNNNKTDFHIIELQDE